MIRAVCTPLLAALLLGACAASEPPRASTKAAEAPSVPAAGSEAPPATAGARCEHGVLAVVCPKCNPRLAPVFQAKGDWCAEHGFPESFCPICHPERGGAPAVEVAKDAAPPEGTKVRLKTAEDAHVAGIETVPAVARPGGARLSAGATLAFDANRRAEVNVRAPGVVRAVLVDVGTTVKAGEPLAVVESAAVSADQGRRGAAEARLRLAEATLERETRLFESGAVGSSRVDLQACKLEYSIVSPK